MIAKFPSVVAIENSRELWVNQLINLMYSSKLLLHQSPSGNDIMVTGQWQCSHIGNCLQRHDYTAIGS